VEVNVKKLSRTLVVFAALAAVPASVVACGGSVEQPQTSASATTKAPVGASTHGFVKIAGEALGEVPLRAEQRTELEKLASEADARHATLADGRKELLTAIADQIEKGTIDRAALQPKLDRVRGEMEKSRPADEAALARVHALLDAEQRATFADALEQRLHDARGKHHGRQGGEQAGKKGKHGFGLGALAADLNLSDEQRSKIKDILEESRESRPHDGKGKHGPGRFGRGPHHGKRALEAFRGDDFEPGKLHVAKGPHEGQGAARMLDVAEKILPVLTPEQRKIAAEKIRSMHRPD
jgi:Spy/CpxP family protein refolding chaperone